VQKAWSDRLTLLIHALNCVLGGGTWTVLLDMNSSSLRNHIFGAVEEISRVSLVPDIAATLKRTVETYGYTSLGINGLPSPGKDADPMILTESTPECFRDCYVEERFYLVDHICNHARTTYEPFRYSEAPHFRTDASGHKRFMQALDTFDLGRGLVVPIGRPQNIPACIWLAGEDPDLQDDVIRAVQLVALFAASKALALSRPPLAGPRASTLTAREREVLQWVSAGKTSWEIGEISDRSERMINKTISDSMMKLDAVTRAQAVVKAIRIGEIEL
jgi:LuxR family transcriptional regulator, quorum-sensing system regulator BjaR1